MGPPLRHLLSFLFLVALLSPLGCASSVNNNSGASGVPRIRVKLAGAVETVTLSCGVPPLYQLSNQPASQLLNSPNNAIFTVTLTPQGWMAGNLNLGGPGATLHLQPDHDGSVSVNNIPYRGKFRFVPVPSAGA